VSTIKLTQFAGVIPIMGDTNLPDKAAALARNCFLYSGGVSGFNVWEDVKTLSIASTASAFRLPSDQPQATTFSGSTWVEFPSDFTDVIRSFVKDDQFERYYMAAPNNPPRYNTKARMLAGSPAFLLGVPQPFYAPSVATFDTNATTKVTRSYVYTYVSEYGEEGPPSNPTEATSSAEDVWQITYTGLADPSRNLTKLRIYRTITSSQGVATYFQVAEVAMPASNATGVYQDTLKDTVVTANNQLQSTTWFPPPPDLEGWVAMPNGILCGWRGKEVWFSEQYRPHAWSSTNTLYTQWKVIGLGVIGQTVVVCTEGYPATITGINPASMVMASISAFEPCMSRGSIVSTPEGVYYASPNGLILAAQGQFTNVTREIFSKDKWQGSLNLKTLRAARVGTAYLAFGSVSYGGFESAAFNNNAFRMTSQVGSSDGVFFDPQNPSVTSLMRTDAAVAGVQTDPWSGETLIFQNGKIKWLDLASTTKEKYPYLWRSKLYQSAKPENFEAFKVTFTKPSGETVTPTAPRDTALNQTYDNSKYGVMRVYADSRHIASYELWASGEQLRLPSGFYASFWQFEFEGVVDINSIQMATSAKELRGV
jgi:hypothetical protein